MPAATLRRISMKAVARYQVILLGEQRHIRCEQLAQGCCPNNAKSFKLLPLHGRSVHRHIFSSMKLGQRSILWVMTMTLVQCWNWPKGTGGGVSCRNVWNFAQGLKFKAIFTQKWAYEDILPTIPTLHLFTATYMIQYVEEFKVDSKTECDQLNLAHVATKNIKKKKLKQTLVPT